MVTKTNSRPLEHAPERPAPLLDRRPPWDQEAEQALLGSILLRPDVCDDVTLHLQAPDLFDESNRCLFEHMEAMHQANQKIDVALLIDRLKRHGVYETVGGAAYLHKISQSVPNPAHAVYYAKIVADHAKRRDLIIASSEAMRDGYDLLGDTDQIITTAEQAIFAIRDRRSVHEPLGVGEILARCLDDLDRRMRGESEEGVIETGFHDLDATMAGGLRNGELNILAARPSMGKTALATDIARHVSSQGLVLFISLEMPSHQLGERLLIAEAGVNGHRMRSGTLANTEKAKVLEAASRITTWNLHITDDSALTVSQIASIARRTARRRKQPIRLLVIDYLQLIEPDNERDSRQEQVSKIARRLKGLARELGCPILALAQLNRQAEDARDHIPRLSHLRESGAIEQDADVVMFVHREEYYLRGEEAKEKEGQAEIIIAKQRNGPLASIELRWDKTSMRFQNFAPERAEECQSYDSGFDDWNDNR